MFPNASSFFHCLGEISAEADNCVRENKNSNVIRFLSYLVSSQKMGLTSISFGRVGHTHGCLGSLALNLTIMVLIEY